MDNLFSSGQGQPVRFTRKTRAPAYVAWWDRGAGARAPALDRMRTLLHGKLEGKILEVTWYDGSVQTLRDIGRDTGELRKGPAFIEIR